MKVEYGIDPYADRALYRRVSRAVGLVSFEVTVRQTNLHVHAERDLAVEVRDIVLTQRDRLERYIAAHPQFLHALEPLPVEPAAPAIVRAMARAGEAAGVGPMAAVAGAVADLVAEGLGGDARELIVENGGDLFVRSARERRIGVFTGEHARRIALALKLPPCPSGLGICTSSGRIGHSLSLGDAAAATVIAATCALADAAATAVGNRVRGPEGIAEAIRAARGIAGVLGVVVARDGRIGAWGEVEFAGAEP